MKLIFEETRPVGLTYRSWRAGGLEVVVHCHAVAQYAKAQRVLVLDLTLSAIDGSDVPGVEVHERMLLTIDVRSEAIRKTIELVDAHHERTAELLAVERSKHPEPADTAQPVDLS